MTYSKKMALRFLIITIWLPINFAAIAQTNGQKGRPNILIIIADDLGWEDIEPYGNVDVKTPHLAQLSSEGMKFYGMSTATAMCAPTRQQILTGMFPVRNGAYPNHSWSYQGVKSLPQYLRPLGYRVGISGKRHFGPPSSYPFKAVGDDGEITGNDNLKAIQQFIGQDNDQPFALYVASHQTHKPWTKGNPANFNPDSLIVPPYLVDTKVTRKELTEYYAEIEYLDQQVGKILDVLKKSGKADNTLVIFTSEQGPQFPFAKWTCYENGLKTGFLVRWPGKVEPNTINHALTQYVDVVPTLLEAAGGNPGIIHTGRKDALGNHGFDGKSFLSALLDNKQSFRKYVYGIHTTMGILNDRDFYPIRSISDGRYKYIKNLNSAVEFSNITKPMDPILYPNPKQTPWWVDTGLMQSWFRAGELNSDIASRAKFYYKRPAIEFYDLEKDPYELNNLANNLKYTEKIAELDDQLTAWMKQQGDKGLLTEMNAMSRKANLIQAQAPEE